LSGPGWLFAKGVVLGLSIAAPVGPMALLCLRTTLAHGFVPGLLGGLGVAAGDMFYAALAAFGLQAATAVLTGQSSWLGLLGGLYLLWFGLATVRQPLP
jgi:threonine/homoserine/homoserine lactone efflux protein